MDTFQNWLLSKMCENFGYGQNPMNKDISFDSIVAVIRPDFERDKILLNESDIERNLLKLVKLGYLITTNNKYYLTLRAIVYSEAAPEVTKLVQEETNKYDWVKIAWAVAICVVLLTVITSVITVNIVIK